MDWMNRGGRQNQTMNQPVDHLGAHAGSGRSKKFVPKGWLRLAFMTLLFGGTTLIVALLIYTATGAKSSHEGKFVDTNKYQAVFLNGGQIYFGKVKTINSRYLRISDIYYLKVDRKVQPNQTENNDKDNLSLEKLGCEIHRPQDQMIINRDQITFWENIEDKGMVVKAINEYLKKFPNGRDCDETKSSQTP